MNKNDYVVDKMQELIDLYQELEKKMLRYINYDLRIINEKERNPVDILTNLDSKQLYDHYLNKFENDLEHRELLLADIKDVKSKISKYYKKIGVEVNE